MAENMREAVWLFASNMERKLQEHDDRNGWGVGQCSMEFLKDRLVQEVGEAFDPYLSPHARSEKLLNVANFCMMLWNNLCKTGQYK